MKLTITSLLLCLVAAVSMVLAAPEAAVTPAPPQPQARNLERRQDFWTIIAAATSGLNSAELASVNSVIGEATNYADLFSDQGIQSALSRADAQGSSLISSALSESPGILTSSINTSSASSIVSRISSQLSSASATATRSASPTVSPGQDDNDEALPNAAVSPGLGPIGAAGAAFAAGVALIVAAL